MSGAARAPEIPALRILARRGAHALLVLWATASLVWAALFVLPGDPALALAGQRADPKAAEAIRAEWGLDQPPLRQYLGYLSRLASGDLGRSYAQRREVSAILGEAFVRTCFLAGAAMMVAFAGGLLLGTLAAARGGLVDLAIGWASLAGVSMPAFWLGLLLILAFASTLGWLPVSGYGDGPMLLGVRAPGPAHLVLPSLALAVFPAAIIARVTRAALLDRAGAPYRRAARARGLTRPSLLWRHTVRPALGPVVTVAGLLLAVLLGGAVATEVVFAWPGVGQVAFTALRSRDLPVVEGAALLLCAAFVGVNLLVDLVHALLDPRVTPS